MCHSDIRWNFDPATPRGPSMEIRPALGGAATRRFKQVFSSYLSAGDSILLPYCC